MKKTEIYLAYAGAIPFVFCMVCLLMGVSQIPILGQVENIVSLYSLAISVFLAGAHWGMQFNAQDKWKKKLQIMSNFVTLILLFGVLILTFQMQMALFVAGFLFLLYIDYKLYQDQALSHSYIKMRWRVSTIVILSLMISGALA